MADESHVATEALRGMPRTVQVLDRAGRLLLSIEDPSDDVPNMAPDAPEIQLHDATADDVGYCGRCAFWNAPATLGEAGTCQIVTGPIDPIDVCSQFSARLEARDMEADWLPPPGIGDDARPEDDDDIEIVVDGPAPTLEGESHAAILAAFQIEDAGDGFIVSLQPLPGEAEAIAQPDGLPADQLHVTLVYVDGPVAEYGEAVLEELGVLADRYGPLTGEIVGLGSFGPDGFDGITVGLVDSLGVGELRAELFEGLKERAVPVNEDHDFVPHMTLADGRIPDDAQVVGLPLTFDSLFLRDGEEAVSVALMGGDAQPQEDEMPETDVPEAEAPAEPTAPEGASVDEAREARIRAALAAMTDDEVEAIVAAGGARLAEQNSCACGCGGKKGGCGTRDPLAMKASFADVPTEDNAPVDAPAPAPIEEPAEEMTAIAPHTTPTSDDAWDGPAAEVNVTSPNEEPYFGEIFAWRDDEADTSVKAAYRFIHHFVGDGGDPQAASTVACSVGIGVLNGGMGGTTIPDSDREGVYEHLAHHLRDADREPPELLDIEDATTVARAVDAGVEVIPWDHDSILAALVHQIDAEDAEQRLSAARVGPDLADVVGTAVVKIVPELDTAGLTEQLNAALLEVLGDLGSSLSDVPDDALVTELARRWAEGVAAEAEQAAEALQKAKDGETLADDTPPEPAPVEEDAEVIVGEFAEDDLYEWTGVLIVEDMPSGDGRMIAGGALTWRELPIPLMLQTKNAPGHDGAEIAGQIQKIERNGQDIVGWGIFDSGTAGVEYQRLLTEKTMRGVSADIDSVVVEFRDPSSGQPLDPADVLFGGPMIDVLEVLVEGRIMGATGTPFPAFQEAYIELLGKADEAQALVAAAGWISQHTGSTFALAGDGYRAFTPIERAPWVLRGQDPVALVASAGPALALVPESPELEIPLHPPIEWFQPTGSDEPFTVHPDGRISGLIARWGTCHIGNSLTCTPVPHSADGYKHFRTKKVLTAEGELVATGPLVMDTVHPDLALIASDAAAHYHDTGCAVADVAVYDGEYGIEICGALRPDVTPEKIRALRGSDVSPDWRQIRAARGGRKLEAVGLLAVNESGFIVPTSLVASGGVPMAMGRYDSVSGEVTALVAAGMVHRPRPADGDLRVLVAELSEELAEMREALRPLRAERAAAKFAARVLEAAQPPSSTD